MKKTTNKQSFILCSKKLKKAQTQEYLILPTQVMIDTKEVRFQIL
jgi:hypothetical protein